MPLWWHHVVRKLTFKCSLSYLYHAAVAARAMWTQKSFKCLWRSFDYLLLPDPCYHGWGRVKGMAKPFQLCFAPTPPFYGKEAKGNPVNWLILRGGGSTSQVNSEGILKCPPNPLVVCELHNCSNNSSPTNKQAWFDTDHGLYISSCPFLVVNDSVFWSP